MLKNKKRWFNHACSCAVQDREAAHRRYQNLRTQANHNLYISSRILVKSILRLTKSNFINRKCQNLAFSNSSRDFWHLAKISPPTLLLHFSLLSLTLTAVLPSLLSLKLNYFLKPSVITPPWKILGIFLLLIPPPTYLCLLFKFFLSKFSMPSLASILRRLMDLMEYLLSFLRIVLPCWHPAWSNSFASACQHLPFLWWKYAHIQPVTKKGDRSNPSNYRPIALHSCLYKAFESIFNRKIQKHLSTSNLLSDRQYGYRKGCSTGDLLSLLTDSWSSSLSRFHETFSVALDTSKAFDRVWHKSLLSKLPSFGFYSSLCSFISSLLSGRSVSGVVDGHCSSPKPINSGVP